MVTIHVLKYFYFDDFVKKGLFGLLLQDMACSKTRKVVMYAYIWCAGKLQVLSM